MAGLWQKYVSLLDRQPLATKTATSTVGFMLGDVIAQIPDLRDGKKYDFARTARLMAFGAFIHGPVGHYWYGFIDKTIMPTKATSGIAVATKTAIDQILWAPIFTSVFYASMEALKGTPENAIPTIKEKLWPTMLVNWQVWPLAHLINFRFIPSSQRILYINTIQVGYNVFLSSMVAKPTTEEKKE
mmetsp:Transcript_644/g.1201  ORF Transcript_644/g.1201 Transcript_644/m.1201 type:complete len:186 (-) Transcript_644:658-1215(-)|eukprot:CAMPEP_0196654798 /NCGR_PEP_ID=MMETSP1086-20130531/4518_1 /TAXON_ID=77921 /ORGANISM="Cyanoptyche  gloeocystis , Strain SAG4.97" /LENGTH=185 /DNA_ID=CAMNT_0041986761 /DNA_START=69 /DNA_END=626 /DNA_ORIENTATION=+